MSADKLPPKGHVYRYRSLLFWAQGGTIVVEDERNEGDTTVMSVQTFLERTLTVRHMVEERGYQYADERVQDERYIENAVLCAKEAMNQGDPFNPKVLEHFYRHRRKSYIIGPDGRRFSNHTASDTECPAQAALLPPLTAAP